MMKLHLSAALTILLSATIILTSCDKDEEIQSDFSNNITMVRSNNVPASNPATGTIEATYSRNTRLLTYKVTWANLSSNPVAMHIHGLANEGHIAIWPFPNGIAQNITGFKAATSGTLSGSLYADGVVIREDDILSGQFYLDIHTVTYSTPSMYPAGELRGQITFPN